MMGLSYQTSIHKVKDFHMAHGHVGEACESSQLSRRPLASELGRKTSQDLDVWTFALNFSKCGFHVKSQGVMLHHLQGDGNSIGFYLYISADLYIVYDVGMSNNPKTILLLLVLIYALYLFHTCFWYSNLFAYLLLVHGSTSQDNHYLSCHLDGAIWMTGWGPGRERCDRKEWTLPVALLGREINGETPNWNVPTRN